MMSFRANMSLPVNVTMIRNETKDDNTNSDIEEKTLYCQEHLIHSSLYPSRSRCWECQEKLVLTWSRKQAFNRNVGS